MNTISYLSCYAQNGLCVTPLKPKSKQPVRSSWQAQTASEEIPPDCNVGVVLGSASGNLVDIDLDNAIALEVADFFLPETGWEFGRPSTPRAHRIYRLKEDPGGRKSYATSQTKYYGKGSVIEYRANKAQTMFPPSVHEEGEVVDFQRREEIAYSTREDLIEACGAIAAVVELAPHYTEGSRQDFCLALVGTLLAWGVSEHTAERIIRALCKATSDRDVSQRVTLVGRTAARLDQDEPCLQRKRLVELIGPEGEAVVGSVAKHLQVQGRVVSLPRMVRTRSSEVFEFNDSVMGKLFAEKFADQVCYVPELDTFRCYDDGVWLDDKKNLFVGRKFDRLVIELQNAVDPRDRQQLGKYRNASGAKNALSMAKMYQARAVSDFDYNDEILCVNNGVVNLRTGEFNQHDPSHLITRKLDVEFDPDAECPRFQAFLRDTFARPEEEAREAMIAYVQGVLGYCLTGALDRQEFYIFYGEEGRNGKSKLIEIVMRLMGSYAQPVLTETLFDGKSAQALNDLSTLEGARLGVASEAEGRGRLNAPLIKGITGGDMTKVKPLWHDVRSAKLVCKLVLVCNQRPNLDVRDTALRRRVRLIPFTNVVPEGRVDANLGNALWEERSGILNFLLEGAKRHFDRKLFTPPEVKAATETYFNDKDTVGSFLEECTEIDREARIAKGALYEAYQRYCDEEGLEALGKGEFGKSLTWKKIEDTREASTRLWKGIRLKDLSQDLWCRSNDDTNDMNLLKSKLQEE